MKIIGAVPMGICSMPVPFQRAGITALKKGWDFVDEMRHAFKERIDYFVPRLNEIEGVRCPHPEGAFYVFPDISELKCPSMDFSREFFHHEKVRCAPGTQYGPNGEGHIRFALVRPVEDLEEVATRLERFIKNLPTAIPSAYP
jgi:aspartate/methionine/tyrosine aminotransferase